MSDANVNMAASAGPINVPPKRDPRSDAADSDVSPTAPPDEKAPAILAAPEQSQETSKKELLNAEVRKAVESLGSAAEIIDRNFKLKVDEDTDRLIIQVVNRETEEVIRQFPEEEALNITKRLREYIGLVFDVEV